MEQYLGIAVPYDLKQRLDVLVKERGVPPLSIVEAGLAVVERREKRARRRRGNRRGWALRRESFP